MQRLGGITSQPQSWAHLVHFTLLSVHAFSSPSAWFCDVTSRLRHLVGSHCSDPEDKVHCLSPRWKSSVYVSSLILHEIFLFQRAQQTQRHSCLQTSLTTASQPACFPGLSKVSTPVKTQERLNETVLLFQTPADAQARGGAEAHWAAGL